MVSAARLLRALVRSARDHGCDAEVTLVRSRDWASATFVGARYEVAVILPASAAAADWISALPEADLPMPRQFAREVRVTGREDEGDRLTVTAEAVVLEE